MTFRMRFGLIWGALCVVHEPQHGRYRQLSSEYCTGRSGILIRSTVTSVLELFTHNGISAEASDRQSVLDHRCSHVGGDHPQVPSARIYEHCTIRGPRGNIPEAHRAHVLRSYLLVLLVVRMIASKWRRLIDIAEQFRLEVLCRNTILRKNDNGAITCNTGHRQSPTPWRRIQ